MQKNMIKFRNKIHNADWGELFSTNDVEHAMDIFYKTYYNPFIHPPKKALQKKGKREEMDDVCPEEEHWSQK